MIKSFPFYFQHDMMDCGAACLTMLADYYGRKLPQEKIAELCKITRNGVSMLALKRAAGQLGLQGTGATISLQVLIEANPLPCILHWNQSHFVVLYRISKSICKKRHYIFHIADPVYGHVKFSVNEIREHWICMQRNNEETGLLMYFEPTCTFYTLPKQTVQNKGLGMLLKYFTRYKNIFFQLGIGLFFGSVLQLIFPFLTQAIVDIGIGDHNLSFIYIILLAQATLIFSRTIVEFIRSWLLLHMSVRINLSLISSFISKLIKLPMSFFEAKKTGDFLQRIADHEKIENFITSKSLQTIFSFFTLLTFSIVLLYYNLIIFLVFITGSILYALWVAIFLKKRKLLNYKFFNKKSQNQSNTYQLITGMQEIKLQGCADRKQSEWEDIQVDMLKLHTETLKINQYSEIGNILINEGKNMVITILAATAVISGEMTLGMMLAVQYIIGQLILPVEQTVQFILSMQDVKISMDRINEIYNKTNEIKPDHIIPQKLPDGDIKLNHIYFKYDETNYEYVLQNVSFTIPRGKITAIVGCSGSGKTTLIKLLLCYYKLDEGNIIIGDIDLSKVNPDWWREQCSVVMQDGYIFSDTIARNIATKNEEIDLQRLEYAAKMANIFDTIMTLPLKYNTIIGAEGQGLSQGQRQRLLIARAIYKNTPFIFFDEATNSLDANNEKVIVKNLNSYYTNKTVVIVAHRLSTVKNADQIIVLNQGKVVEIGCHSNLIAAQGYYYKLIKNQLSLDI